MVTPLADGIWWYDLGGVNAYLIDENVVESSDVSGVTLVDAGMPWHGNRLIGGIADAGYDLSDIERILLTHYDFDHAGGLADLDGLDATIYVGAADAPLVTGDQWRVRSSHVDGRVKAVEVGQSTRVIEIVVGQENSLDVAQVVSRVGDATDQAITVPGHPGVDECHARHVTRLDDVLVDQVRVDAAEVVPPDTVSEGCDHTLRSPRRRKSVGPTRIRRCPPIDRLVR